MAEPPEVLFVCVHNAGRSQMAATLLDHHAQGRIRVRSAGSAPAEQINPAVVEAMAELGIDISHHVPVKLLTEHVAASDVVITMGCGDTCPIYPGKRYEDWDLPDPADKTLESTTDPRRDRPTRPPAPRRTHRHPSRRLSADETRGLSVAAPTRRVTTCRIARRRALDLRQRAR